MNVSYRVLSRKWISHSQALDLRFLIWKKNVTALFYPEMFLTSHPFQEAQGRVLECTYSCEVKCPWFYQILL